MTDIVDTLIADCMHGETIRRPIGDPMTREAFPESDGWAIFDDSKLFDEEEGHRLSKQAWMMCINHPFGAVSRFITNGGKRKITKGLKKIIRRSKKIWHAEVKRAERSGEAIPGHVFERLHRMRMTTLMMGSAVEFCQTLMDDGALKIDRLNQRIEMLGKVYTLDEFNAAILAEKAAADEGRTAH